MSKKPTLKAQVALAAIKQHPKAPSLTLAKKIYKESPELFTDIEDARGVIRYHSGESGKNNRVRSKVEKREKITMPESWAEPMDIFYIPKGYKKIGVISDAQAPFHDPKALQIALDHLNKIGIDALIMNGDMIDFYGLSSFQKDPRKRNFAEERETCIQLLRYIRQEVKCPIYYSLDANHEQRYERYMMTKAPEFFSTNFFQIEDLMQLHDIGMIPLRGYSHIMAGKLAILHGHTIFRGQVSPVSPARTVQMKLNQSALVSHVHKKSQYTWTTLDGDSHSTWTTGCLAKIGTAVDYNPHGNNYVHGFAWIEILDDKGMYAVENKMIVNGKVV